MRIAVLRGPVDAREVLLLLHPDTAPQLPGGGIDAGETPLQAGRRELFEEAGLDLASEGELLGPFDYRLAGGPFGDGPLETQRWYVWRVEAPADVPDAWTHHVRGGGVDAGLRFGDCWARLEPALADAVHERFRPLVTLLIEGSRARTG